MRHQIKYLLATWLLLACGLSLAQVSSPSQYVGEGLTYATTVRYDGGAVGFRFWLRTSVTVPLPKSVAVQIGNREQIGDNLSVVMVGFGVQNYELPWFRESVIEVSPRVYEITALFTEGLQAWARLPLTPGDYLFALNSNNGGAFYWQSFMAKGATWYVGGSSFAVDPFHVPWRNVHNTALAVEFVYP